MWEITHHHTLHYTISVSSPTFIGIVSLILGATVYEDLSLTAVLVIVMPLLWTLLTVVGVELLVVREGDSRSDFKRATRTENGKADEEFVITGVESRDRDEVTGDSGLESRKEEMEGTWIQIHEPLSTLTSAKAYYHLFPIH